MWRACKLGEGVLESHFLLNTTVGCLAVATGFSFHIHKTGRWNMKKNTDSLISASPPKAQGRLTGNFILETGRLFFFF